jgi:hypothetical protein
MLFILRLFQQQAIEVIVEKPEQILSKKGGCDPFTGFTSLVTFGTFCPILGMLWCPCCIPCFIVLLVVFIILITYGALAGWFF